MEFHFHEYRHLSSGRQNLSRSRTSITELRFVSDRDIPTEDGTGLPFPTRLTKYGAADATKGPFLLARLSPQRGGVSCNVRQIHSAGNPPEARYVRVRSNQIREIHLTPRQAPCRTDGSDISMARIIPPPRHLDPL